MMLRMRVVTQVLEGKVPLGRLSRIFGPSRTTILKWVDAYKRGGIDAPEPKPTEQPVRRQVWAEEAEGWGAGWLRGAQAEAGRRRLRGPVAGFEALGVSETEVRRILHEEGFIATSQPVEKREHPERRFERASPNELWQSDIFTFLLRRHERIYLTAFMDDHSRFIVSYALGHHQKSSLVMEALLRGIAEYGTPKELLTDNGRQYTAWRGETEFEEELRRQGIRHIKSRPQHPQTLGKVERFWKTLWEEFLSRTVFADFADCARRLRLFIDASNFQRPHQGVEGLVPADRFFRAPPHVRETIEKNIEQNRLRLALEQPPRKPFYLVGRFGDQNLTIAAAGRGPRVKLGDDPPQTLLWPKEETDEHAQSQNRIHEDHRIQATQTPSTTDPALAASADGFGRDRQAPVPFGLERLEPRASGDGHHRGGADLATDVLPTRR